MRFIGSLARLINALFPFLLPLNSLLDGRTFRGLVRYVRNAFSYVRAEHKVKSGFGFKWGGLHPCLLDRFEAAGNIPRHYFWQDLWAARKVHQSRVSQHYDIGSRLDGFIAHCLPFCEVVMLDIRPLSLKIKGLSFKQTDCMNMSNISSDSILSLSCLHAIEHFGLGRYGDPIDPMGHIKAISEIKRVVAPVGNVYFSVPIGIQRLEFDGHRIFDPISIPGYFEEFELVEFSVVDDDNVFHENVDPRSFQSLSYGCGLYHFQKKIIAA